MEPKKQSWKRVLVGFFVALVFVSPLALLPQRAHADIPVIEVILDGLGAGTLVENILEVAESVYQSFVAGEDWYKEWVADPLAWVAQNGVIQSVVNSAVSEIVEGPDGAPSFVTSLQDQLLQQGDSQVMAIMGQLRSTWAINVPFGDTVLSLAEANEFRTTGPGAFERGTQFSLGDYTNNVDECLSGNIRIAGLSCILGGASSFMNSPGSAQSIVENQLAAQRSSAEAALRDTMSEGFLATVRCPDAETSSGETGTGGTTVALSEGQQSRVGCTTETPAHTLSAVIDSVLPASLQRLNQGDEISELLGSLFASFISDMIGGDGLLGSSRPSAGGGRSFLDNATDITNTPGGEDILAGYIARISDQIAKLNTAIVQLQKIQTAALAAQAECGVGNPAIAAALNGPGGTISRIKKAQDALNGGLLADGTPFEGLLALLSQAQQAEAANNPNLLGGLLEKERNLPMPSMQDMLWAQEQSKDTSGLPTTGGLQPSLYTQMITLSEDCSSNSSVGPFI